MSTRAYNVLAIFSLTLASLQAASASSNLLSVAAKDMGGGDVELAAYAGKVVLVVNVASRCGFTRQYGALQSIYEQYAGRGFVILGFPCNQFGSQEPGTDAEIQAFCEKQFAVSFPMFSKIDVNGEHAHPLYRSLTSDNAPIDDRGPVQWNFEKFLIDRAGRLVARFRSRTPPDAPEVIRAIETAIGNADAIGRQM